VNINIYLENNLGDQIKAQAKTLGKSRNAIIREAIREWLMHHKARKWSPIVRNFKGVPEFTRFESYRSELTEPKEDPFK